MNPSVCRAATRILNALPRRFASAIVARVPRLVAYLDENDIAIRLKNCYYGDASFVLSTKYRIERSLLYSHVYDERTLLYIMRLVAPGAICIDVGANIGSIALCLAHHVGPGGFVAAFEPGPLLFERLERNVSASRIDHVRLYRIGLGNKSASFYWNMEEGENAGNAFLSESFGSIQIPVEKLDDIRSIRTLKSLDFIKIDVEGMELQVVQGGLQTIRRFKPILLVETRRDEGPLTLDVDELLTLLSDEGYEFWETDIPRESLRPCNTDFNFVRCQYPMMPQNTLCIHKSRREILNSKHHKVIS